MRLRSLLFVPGDRPDRMDKALGSGADALILDLEDSVTPTKKSEARKAVAEFLGRPRTRAPRLFVRINPLGTCADEDLAAIMPQKPDGIVLPKAEGGASIAELDRRLTALGDRNTLILPIATETPAAIFALGFRLRVGRRRRCHRLRSSLVVGCCAGIDTGRLRNHMRHRGPNLHPR